MPESLASTPDMLLKACKTDFLIDSVNNVTGVMVTITEKR